MDIKYFLIPSDACIVDFCLDGAYCLEILLTDILKRETSRYAAMHCLAHLRLERDIAEYITSIEANAEVIAMLSHLCIG